MRPPDRRAFAAVLTVFALAAILLAPIAAAAQQPSRTPRIGWLSPGSPATHGMLLEAFREGLREEGYGGARPVELEVRWAEGNMDRLPELAADLVRRNVDLIMTGSSPGIRAAMQATKTIPIVFGATGDPVSQGYVASLARPGGNVTGLSVLGADLSEKRLEILKEVFPELAHASLLFNPNDNGMAIRVQQSHVAAKLLGVSLSSAEVRTSAELDSALAGIASRRGDALVTIVDAFTLINRGRIIRFAAEHGLPAMYESREFVMSGGLLSYGPRIEDNYRRAASYAHKILNGANPGDLPVEQPTRFELVINLKAAAALGLSIPPSLIARADEVID